MLKYPLTDSQLVQFGGKRALQRRLEGLGISSVGFRKVLRDRLHDHLKAQPNYEPIPPVELVRGFSQIHGPGTRAEKKTAVPFIERFKLQEQAQKRRSERKNSRTRDKSWLQKLVVKKA